MAGTQNSEDKGTVLESLDALAELYGNAALADGRGRPDATALEPPPAPADAVHESRFRPVLRPSTPRLTILDDGEPIAGEVFRLRESVTLIGRTEGAVRLPHDNQVSKRHAEIVREGTTVFRWLLRDLDSSNGTFVKCSQTVLRGDRIVILGAGRYRLRLPSVPATTGTEDGTCLATARGPAKAIWPALVETSTSGPQNEIPLSAPFLKVGRPGCGNDVELDDPLIARHHATISRLPSGEWQITALPSHNGVWSQIRSITLTNRCHFQCGEQRFLFSFQA